MVLKAFKKSGKLQRRSKLKILVLLMIIAFSSCVFNNDCGSGSVHLFGEDCDDGNNNNNDGCDSGCNLEPGFSCSGTGVNQLTTCTPNCRDGQTRGNEECDDQNDTNGDGCDSNCRFEAGFTCSGTGIGQKTSCSPVCRDGLKRGSEQCDDNNGINNDGCSYSCQIESGWECPTHNPSVCNLICSNGILNSGEICDDGNANNNDGCSSSCQVEPDYECFGSPSVCNLICSNGRLDPGETCDDGNLNNNDGCSSTCQTETGYACNGQPSNCDGICGDSLIRGTEECDDSDLTNDNGCSDECNIETGFSCTGEPSTCIDICGDSLIVTSTQECDDGGNDNDDGCSHDCVIETGWLCENAPSECDPICADGLVRGKEECDDNNLGIDDGCNNQCEIEAGWSCSGEPSVCIPIHSDGLVVGIEECDDGNDKNRDGCTHDSKQEDFHNCTGQPSICEKVPSTTLTDSQAFAGSIIQNGITSSFVIGIAVSFLINIPTSSLWSLINTLQILHYIPMFNLYFPANVLKLFTFLGISNMQNEYLSSIFLKHIDEEELNHHTEVNYRYANQGYESTSVLINSPDTLSFLVLFLGYYCVILILYFGIRICHQGDEKSSWLVRKICGFISNEAENIWMNIIIRIGFEVFLDLTFSGVLNLRYFSLKNNNDIYSSAMSVFISSTMLLFSIIVSLLCINKMINPIHVPMIKLHEQPRSALDVLFREIKPEKNLTPFLHITFLLQRIFLIYLIIDFRLTGTFQIILFCCFTFLKSLYLVCCRPSISPICNIQDFINEFILCFVCVFFTQFGNPISEFVIDGRPYVIGFACIALIMSPIVIFYGILGVQVVAKCCRQRSSKIKVTIEKPEILQQKEGFKKSKITNKFRVTPIPEPTMSRNSGITTTVNSRYLDKSIASTNIRMNTNI